MKCFAEPFRLDRNRNRGGLMIYIGDDTPRRLLLKHAFPSDIEGLYIELNFKKCKWLLLGTYYPPSESDQYYFNSLENMDTYSSCEKILLVGDFSAGALFFINMNYRVSKKVHVLKMFLILDT